jgi:hypothetical protein
LEGIGRLIVARGLLNIISGGTEGTSFGTSIAGIGKILGFANGGRPPVGRASIVGERGPELFVPSVPGEVIPNYKLAGAMRGGGDGGFVRIGLDDGLVAQMVGGAVAIADGRSVARLNALQRPRMPVAAGA